MGRTKISAKHISQSHSRHGDLKNSSQWESDTGHLHLTYTSCQLGYGGQHKCTFACEMTYEVTVKNVRSKLVYHREIVMLYLPE
jgi:hypothetical protein